MEQQWHSPGLESGLETELVAEQVGSARLWLSFQIQEGGLEVDQYQSSWARESTGAS